MIRKCQQNAEHLTLPFPSSLSSPLNLHPSSIFSLSPSSLFRSFSLPSTPSTPSTTSCPHFSLVSGLAHSLLSSFHWLVRRVLAFEIFLSASESSHNPAIMSSRQQIDSVIDDDDEFWYVAVGLSRHATWVTNCYNSPLCIEEFDLSDKNFKPCPCGYQVWLTAPFSCAPASCGVSHLICAIADIVFRSDLPILLQQHQNP